MAGAEPELEETAKVEICFSTEVLEQDGHEVVSPHRRISCSNS